jgi:hypothetical protein
MSIEQKEAKIIDLNLFSGSADRFRTACKVYFEIIEGDDGSTVEQTFSDDGGDFLSYPMYDWADTGDLQSISAELLIPNYKFAMTIPSLDLGINVPDDNFWKTYWIGGSFGAVEYPGIYNETVWDDYWFETALPYSQLEAKTLVEKDNVTNVLNISCEYNYYLPQYQEHVAGLNSELLIPNMYLIDMFNTVTISSTTDPEGLLTESESVDSRVFDPNVVKFVSLEETYATEDDASNPLGNINDLLTDVDTVWGSELPDYVLHGYLSQSVVINDLSASTIEYAENAFQNMFFDEYSILGGTTIQTFNTIQNTKSLFPYYIDISFPTRPAITDEDTDTSDNTRFVTSLSDSNYSSKFLTTLKEAFNEEIEDFTLLTQDYALSLDYQISSEDDTVDDQIQTTETTSLRSVDYFDLLVKGYKNYESKKDNCYFVGERLIDREIAMGVNGSYRYVNSQNALGAIEGALEIVKDSDIGPSSTLGNGLSGTEQWSSAQYWAGSAFWEVFGGWRASGKYNETIAYRIEKIGGTPEGDLQTQNVLQNYWIFNSSTLADINLFDSQVKYGENYTYNIYAYVVSVGIKYKLSDLALSRQINYDETASSQYCLEFYNPFTGETVDRVYQYADAGTADLPDSLLKSNEPYEANFNVNFEPSIRLFEVPIGSKTLNVLDNPPNQLTINPFQVLDASQTIGYEAYYEAFVEQLYPKTISSADLALKEEYLNAKNLLDEDDLFETSISQQRYIEVYRVGEKPSSFEDFDGNIIRTIDLKLKDSRYTLSNSIFYDMIRTNQKYYYIFRVLNENMMGGHLSEIYEAELINDGGYTYSNFEVLFEEDLQEEKFINPSLSFKKLIQLQPNIAQINLNADDVDYDAPASDQLINMSLGDADELIWDKTFKIRLTSKKTGRKMDLNVTYKYERESN